MSIQKLYLELSDRCNLNCSICYRQSWSEVPQDLETVIYEGLLSELKTLPTLKTIVLGGIGEPTCAPRFLEVVKELKDYRLILTTNGVGLSDEILESILVGIDTVVFSIDGTDEVFESIRGVPLNAVTETMEKLNALKKKSKTNKPSIHMQCVLSEDNVHEALALVELASTLHVENLIFSNLMPQIPENKDKILYTRYDNPRIKGLFNQLRVRSFRRGVQLTLPNYELRTERFCSFIEENATFVSAEGEVIPCYRLSHGYKEFVFGREKRVLRHSFGNLKEQSLMSIWNSKSYVSYRERVRNNRYPSCIDCDLVDGCEYVTDTDAECFGGTPSCADCLWSRRIVICP